VILWFNTFLAKTNNTALGKFCYLVDSLTHGCWSLGDKGQMSSPDERMRNYIFRESFVGKRLTLGNSSKKSIFLGESAEGSLNV